MKVTDKITITNEDNMALMSRYEDNHFDLAIVDPPYGIDINSSGTHFKEKYDVKEWDKETPSDKYFDELKRVSKNQIIWGGNYYFDRLGNCKCFLIWDKKIAEGMSFAMCELAWTSFKNGAKIYKNSATQLDRIHPTQKPVKLYEWLLMNYAKEGDKILDTHLGSGSIAIACDNLGFELTACELDKEYFESAIKRFKQQTAQQKMF
jgi:site-specific DNA-methyltransferase (adenine-specific)